MAQAPGATERASLESTAVPRVRARPAEIRVLAPTRYSLHLTMTAETHAKLRRAQDLLRHVVPSGDPAAVVERALTLLVEHLERSKYAATKSRPAPARDRRTRSRRQQGPSSASQRALPPATPPTSGGTPPPSSDVRVHTSDSGTAITNLRARRCTSRPSRHIPAAVKRQVWTRDEGRCAFVGTAGRCTETAFLEFHHRIPFAEGGEAMTANIELRCKAHNNHEARQWFGAEAVPGGVLEETTRPGPS